MRKRRTRKKEEEEEEKPQTESSLETEPVLLTGKVKTKTAFYASGLQ